MEFRGKFFGKWKSGLIGKFYGKFFGKWNSMVNSLVNGNLI